MVSGKLDVALDVRVNQYKLCVQSLFPLNSLISVCIFVNLYKQPIVSTKQPIVFLVLY